MAVFAEHGYRLTDVQEIADRLGMGKGTVYRYFATKEDLFLAAVDRGMRWLQETIDAQIAETADPLEQMRRAVRAYLAYFDTHPELVELLIQERAEFKDRKQSTYACYEEQCRLSRRDRLASLQEQGLVRKIPVDQIIDVGNYVMYGAIFINHLAGRRKTFQEQADEILDVMMHGILKPGTPDGATASQTQDGQDRRPGDRSRQRTADKSRGESR